MASAGAVAAAQVISAGVAVAGTAVSIHQNRQAAKDQEKAQDVQQRIAEVEEQRKRALALRQARIQRARIENIAAQTGTSGSSGETGALQSISNQTNANLSFLDVTSQLANQATAYNRSAARRQSNAATAGAITDVASQYADFGALVE